MSIALFGIAVTQFIYIKTQVDLGTKNFEDKVYIAMNNVKYRLLKDGDQLDVIKKMNEKIKDRSVFGTEITNIPNFSRSLSPDNKNYLNDLYEFSSIMRNVYPDHLFEEINKENLDAYIKAEMAAQEINIKYDYGVYSNKEQQYIIKNGYFAVPFEGSASKPKGESGLEESPYKVELYDDKNQSLGYLKIFFPGKQGFLWSSVLPSMLTSFLFTGLVLFCFAYTIFVIFRQKKVSEMKTDFINNMTHEFKTPIATISLATDSINNSTVINNEKKVRRFTDIIQQENKRMLNQVEKVLQMAKIDRKDFQLKITHVNLNDLAYQACENAKLKILKRNGNLETNLGAKKPIVEGDLTHLSNIIHNLLDNAEKYSEDKPFISVTTRNVTGGVEIDISDNGIGMNKDAQKHIFDKFYRVHTGNRHDVKGFGLGLSYVKALMDAHNGTVKVNSEIDKGSTFTLFFPFIYSD